MNNAPLFFIVGLVIVAIVIYNNFFSAKAVIKRTLRKAPQKQISEITDGEIVKFIGTVESIDEPLLSPLSNRKCTYYSIIIEQKVSSGKNSHWKTLVKKKRSNKFVIRDKEHHAIINTKNIKSHIVVDREYSSGFLNDVDPRLEAYLLEHNIKSETAFGFNKTLRYREGVLELGEKIAVLGKGKWENGSDFELPSEIEKVLSVSPGEKDFIYLSDATEVTTVIKPNEPPVLVDVTPIEQPKRKAKRQKRIGRYLK